MRREPVSSRLFVKIGRAFAKFAQGFAENRKLIARFGAGQAKPQAIQSGIGLTD